MLKAILIFIVVLLAIAGLAWGSMKALDRFSPKPGRQGSAQLPKQEKKDSDGE